MHQRLETHRLEKRDQRFVVRFSDPEVFDRHIERHPIVEGDEFFRNTRGLGIVDERLAALVLLDLVYALEQRFEVAVFADQLGSGLHADARHTGHVVG